MNAYGMDFTLLDFGLPDHLLYEGLTHDFAASSSPVPVQVDPTFRHDGTSPLPLGMEWSPPPQKWYYRVQVGIQTPEAITTVRAILHRFSDFLKLFSELQKLFPKKILPAPPSKKLVGARNRSLIEERRISLEVWIEKLLSNINVSRSAPVAIFLELEAAARSSFNDTTGNDVSSFIEYKPSSRISVIGDASSVTSDYGDNASYGKSDIEAPEDGGRAVYTISRSDIGWRKDVSYDDASENASYDDDVKEILSPGEDCKVMDHVMSLSTDGAESEVSSLKASELSNDGTSRAHNEGGLNFSVGAKGPIDENLLSPTNLLVVLPSDQRHKFSRVLSTMQRRLAIAKADMEDLVARLNQEVAVRQYLTTKVTDLEVDLESTKENTKDNLQQALSVDKERYTQIQWDMEELRKKCLEMEMKLKAEQDEKMRMVSENLAVIQEIEMLRQELDVSRDQLDNLQKNHEVSETKSKTDLKVLVKEVKSLRNSQSDLKQELSNLMKVKIELERDLQNEKQRKDYANAVNEKLLHECSTLQRRLEESSVNFLVAEEDKLVLDTSPSDASDLLTTSDNRIGLLLAEAQLLAQDVENTVDMSDSATVDELRKMVTELFIDNAKTRKQMNSFIRCALKTVDLSEKEDEGKEAPLKQTVLGKFL
ncbi:PX domain-containing protein EREX isoform X2 [Beta vulgaris subsp. vulgaris]|uniref:PX domain-containing protein EREX isoform X2 n=1 Tax=Beta vulgaris subsp. vulgaris TaxID=3555 RepID=UPI002036DD6E|nr:PX domain-containing protein EREX isoform X2 [Beta vulgaris subsp. vulgaris]